MQWYEGAGQTSAVKDLRKGLPFLPSTQSMEERRALETKEQGSYTPGRALSAQSLVPGDASWEDRLYLLCGFHANIFLSFHYPSRS